MGEKVFECKEQMVRDWGRVMIAVIRSNSGESNVDYKRDDDDNITGLTAELGLQFENAVSNKVSVDHEKAIEEAKRLMADLVTKEGEFTSKQRLLIDWMSMKNAILKSQYGEMKVGIRRNRVGNLVVGLIAELDLTFGGPTPSVFTDNEKASIDEAKNIDN